MRGHLHHVTPLNADTWSHAVIGAAIKVHRVLGPGLFEKVYVTCVAHELRKLGLDVRLEVPIPLKYDGILFPQAYRADLIVEGALLVEAKAVDKLPDIYLKKLETYLRLTEIKVGLLINFNVKVLRDGITRVVNKL